MNSLQNIVWPLVALGAIGAFIDFLIGEKGRKRTIKWISRTWDNYFRQITLPEFPEIWSMDFMFDRIASGRTLKNLVIVERDA